MTTQQNINAAAEVALRDKNAADTCLLNKNAFAKYIEQVNNGLWNTNINPVPSTGPFTMAQAALIQVQIPNDYDFPEVFTNYDIMQRAADKLLELSAECDQKMAAAEASAKTLADMQKQYADDLARAQELANNDPAVIAAKENAAAATIQRQTELEKKTIEQQNIKMIVGVVVALFLVVVLVSLLRNA